MSCCIVLLLTPGSCILFKGPTSRQQIRVIRAGLIAAAKCKVVIGAAYNPTLLFKY